MMSKLVAPSILAVWDSSGGDYDMVLARGTAALHAGADWLHVDVMDGVAVPAVTFRFEMVEKLRTTVESAALDVHLMVDLPERVVGDYVRAGAGRVVFHPAFCEDIGGALGEIKSLGAVAGLALDVDEPVDMLQPWLGQFTQVLVMTVKAGAGGQSFRPEMLDKVRAVRELCGPDVVIVVDGGVKANVAEACRGAGANVLVAGSAVFGAADLGTAIAALKA